MAIYRKAAWDKFTTADVTPETIFKDRRRIVQQMGLLGAGALLSSPSHASLFDVFDDKRAPDFIRTDLNASRNVQFDAVIRGALTPQRKIISHNNFYEFGTSKTDPIDNAQGFKVDPWTLVIEGEVERSVTLDYDDLMNMMPLQERIYQLRCVEAWSMVIPWIGFPLASLLKKVVPTSKAKYVAFETLYSPQQMPGQRSRIMGGGIDYPYVEGLTLAEAMNELTFLSVGLYGKTLPPQNGAPIRLVVPWKYGFKSIKSIVRIRLTDKQPATSWNQLAPAEYGFYANVNPNVDHPRWSQASERRIGEGGLFSARRINTEMFNGYSEQVASLYKGINLKRYF